MLIYIITGYASNQAHNINFSYIQTKSQLADGLTKPLPCQRHKNWVSLVHFISFPTKKQAITVRHSSWFPTWSSADIKRLYTLYISYIGDTTNLYTEQKQSRSHMLLRTLISKINQHRNGRWSPPGTATIKWLPTQLKQAALLLYRVGVAYDHISFYICLNLRAVCKPRALH
jgi:hypothetical protein